MAEAQTDDNNGQPTHDGRDVDLLLRVLDAISERIVGSAHDAIAAVIASHLGSLPAFEAVGVWFVSPDDGEPKLRDWSSSFSDERDANAMRAAESLTREYLGDARPVQGEIPFSAAGSPVRPRTFVCLPIYRAGPLGMILLIGRRRVGPAEIAALSLLSRQVATELARAPRPETARPDLAGSTQFIALIAHELRTPLTALRGNVQLAEMAVRKGDLTRVDARLKAAIKGVDAISALVQNLQDMSHLERGKFQLARVRGDLTPTVRNAVKRAERLINDGHHTIRIEAPSEAESYFDPARMEQAVFNVLVNALQYSPDGGTVVVHVECGEQDVVVSVSDNGVGITPDEQQKVFEPYYRGSVAKTTNAKGLGLGLTISRATVERHGGSIGVESSPGAGSTVQLRLPRAHPENQH